MRKIFCIQHISCALLNFSNSFGAFYRIKDISHDCEEEEDSQEDEHACKWTFDGVNLFVAV